MTVQSNSPMVMTSLTEELKKLTKQGWYWRPITLWEVEGKLVNTPDGSFLVRESSDDHYLLSVSFRTHHRTLHTIMEHSNGRMLKAHASAGDSWTHRMKKIVPLLFRFSAQEKQNVSEH
ncbi:hypothetical protein AB1E18_001331 [Capra hircus]